MEELNGLKSAGERVRRIVRGTLPTPLYSRCATAFDAWHGVRAFGFGEYRNLTAISRMESGGKPAEVHLRTLPHPFYVRPGSPDANLVLHAIAREAYSYRLPDLPVRLIIDAGANIGDTTAWYATHFPEATVVAIEPNPDNFDILLKNCSQYGGRVSPLRRALWPTADQSLAITGVTESAQVRESKGSNDLTCTSIDPLTILRDSGRDAIDIFKIDIEGAELALFSGECDVWLRKTRTIAIEIHSPEAFTAVFAATKRNKFNLAKYRDLHFFWK